jgi:hypothetical protein
MSQELPPLRLCPRCRITMQAERSQPSVPGYDTFTCLRCDLVLSYRRPQGAVGVAAKPAHDQR